MTIFEWCDKHPSDELFFKYRNGIEIQVRSLRTNQYDILEGPNDIDISVIKDWINKNKRVSASIYKVANELPDSYVFEFSCDHSKYKHIVGRHIFDYICGGQLELNNVIRSICNTAEEKLCAWFLRGRIKMYCNTCTLCKYYEEEDGCIFFSQGSGNPIDMPCYEEKED